MPKGGKRKDGTPEHEIEEAEKRMRKYKECLESARDSETWLEFLEKIGVNIDILESDRGQDFWEKVRQKIDEPLKENIFNNLSQSAKGETPEIRDKAERRSSYSIARYFGASAKEARQVRDWSNDRLAEYLGFDNYELLLKEIYD